MRALIIVVFTLGLGYWIATDYAKEGRVERFLDAHPSSQRNAPVEYYWAMALRLMHNAPAAIYRYRRVVKKYPDTAYAPLAWIEIIDIYYEDNNRESVFREAEQFLAAYADHPKAELVRKKVYFLQSGM